MKKRIFSVLAVVLMLISSLGLHAFAEQPSENNCPIVIKSANFDTENKIINVTFGNTSAKNCIIIPLIYGDSFNAILAEDATNPEITTVMEQLVLSNGQNIMSYQSAVSAGGEVNYAYEVADYTTDTPKVNVELYYFIENDVITDPTSPDVEQGTHIFENILAQESVAPAEAVMNFISQTAIAGFMENPKTLIMILIACFLMYLAIGKGYEPLLLLPIAFGMLLTNLPGAEMFHEELFAQGHVHWNLFDASNNVTPGLIDILYLGVKLGIYPCLIFLGVGAMTDFGPLIANPKSLLLGAAAQLGIFVTYAGATALGFNPAEASSIGIIGGADGPTAIFVTSKLAPHLLGPIAVAAYSYMALIPVIQPPFMRLLTTKKERKIEMTALREVSKTEKIIFPIVVTIFVAILVPSAAPLIGCLMLGNLFRESGVTDRLSKTVQNELCNIVTIFLGVSVGATATADTFLSFSTFKIIVMGVVAFIMGTCGGILLAKFMNLFLKKKINPLIGSAGVSAVPMAARMSQKVGQEYNPKNFLLMHAMGPNVAGVIGSAIAAGVLLSLFG